MLPAPESRPCFRGATCRFSASATCTPEKYRPVPRRNPFVSVVQPANTWQRDCLYFITRLRRYWPNNIRQFVRTSRTVHIQSDSAFFLKNNVSPAERRPPGFNDFRPASIGGSDAIFQDPLLSCCNGTPWISSPASTTSRNGYTLRVDRPGSCTASSAGNNRRNFQAI